MEISRGYWFWEGQLSREDGGYTDFIGFDVNVRGNDGTCGIVDAFSLENGFEHSVRNGKIVTADHHILPEQTLFLL